jgi:hypothetical protein
VSNGDAARMVLYQYDFVDGTPLLNVRGQDRLAEIVELLGRTPFPMIIERTPCLPGLAEARRLTVLNALAHTAVPVPPERVLIGPPLAVGLSGREATLIYRNLLRQTEAQGVIRGGGPGGPGAGGINVTAISGAGAASGAPAQPSGAPPETPPP